MVDDPSPEGVAGNERLTAMTGALLFLLLAAEGVTLIDLRPLFAVHAFVGILLAGPVAVKIASTGYRFLRYYTGHEGYRRKGPPRPLMRVLAPALIASTVTVIGSGIGLLAVRPGDPGPLLSIHKVSFVAWFALTAVHVLAYAWRIPRLLAEDVGAGTPPPPGRTARLLVSGLGLTVGALAAALLLPYAHPWIDWLSATSNA
ncbi:MAG: hypothetical protein ACRDP1_07360 [Nocardioidaceae bacterium]